MRLLLALLPENESLRFIVKRPAVRPRCYHSHRPATPVCHGPVLPGTLDQFAIDGSAPCAASLCMGVSP